MKNKIPSAKVIGRYDATALIGLPVILIDAAREIREKGDPDPSIALPSPGELSAAAALVRCQMPQRLRGDEVKALRKIADLTQAALIAALGGETAVGTISRWETNDKPVSSYVEKMVRLAVCERLKGRAPGVMHAPGAILALKLTDKKPSPVELRRALVRADGGMVETWSDAKATAVNMAA